MSVQEAAKNFEEQRRRCRMLYLVYGIGMLAALAMMFLGELKSALLIFIVLMIIYFVIVRSAVRQYTASWREYCVRLFTEKHFAPVSYAYRVKAGEIPLLQKYIMMPLSERGKLTARCLARGSRAGIDAEFLDATVTMGNGTSTRFCSGCWMGFSCECISEKTFRAVRGQILEEGVYETWLTQTEGFASCVRESDMPENCRLYARSEEDVLPEAAVQPLRKLLKDMPGSGIVQICPDGLFVYLPHRLINKLPPSLKFPVTESMIDKLSFPEIGDAYMLALALRRPQGLERGQGA